MKNTCPFYIVLGVGYSKKIPNRSWGHTFLKKNAVIFKFFTSLMETPEKTKANRRPKTKTHGNSSLFYFDLWKFHFSFNWPLEFSHAFSSLPLEILCPPPSPPVCIFSGIAHFNFCLEVLFINIYKIELGSSNRKKE